MSSATHDGPDAAFATAIAYARAGFAVLPLWSTVGDRCDCHLGAACGARGKHPISAAVRHGARSASTDHATIRHWEQRFPRANWGIATGKPWRRGWLLVVDIDPRNDGDTSFASLEALHGPIVDTPRVLTGGGGVHHYLVAPVPVASSVLAPGVDLKASGGYVVAPPSIHASGRRYAWDAGAHPADVPFGTAPAWLCRHRPRERAASVEGMSVHASLVGRAFAAAGWAGEMLPNGALTVRCPWVEQHSDGRGDGRDSSTVVLPPASTEGWGCFRCLHGSHGPKSTLDALRALPPQAIAVASHAHPTAFASAARRLARRGAR